MRTLSYLVLLLSCLVARGQATLYNSNIKLAQVNGPRYTNVTSGLVGWWKFDEGSGVVANDSSGQGNTASLTNSPSWTNGVIGSAIVLNATTQQAALMGVRTSLDLTNALSVCGWVNRNDATKYFSVISRRGATLQYQLTWVRNNEGANSDKIRLDCRLSGATVSFNSTTAHQQTNEWHHLAVTYDKQNVCYYFDGVADGQTAETRTIETQAVTSQLGVDSMVNLNFDSGIMDDVRAYNRALSATEVWILYNWRP